jgi:hypothetical protein
MGVTRSRKPLTPAFEASGSHRRHDYIFIPVPPQQKALSLPHFEQVWT